APAPPAAREAAPPVRAWRRGRVAAAMALALLAGGGMWGTARRTARSPAAVPGVVALAGGRFRMGSTAEEGDAAFAPLPGGCTPPEMPQLQREQPPREVTVSPFRIDIDEVDNAAYAGFLAAVAPQLDIREDRDDHSPRFVIERATGLLLADLSPPGGI